MMYKPRDARRTVIRAVFTARCMLCPPVLGNCAQHLPRRRGFSRVCGCLELVVFGSFSINGLVQGKIFRKPEPLLRNK